MGVRSKQTSLDKPWLRDMNAEQLAAIMHDEGPARMLAPAGSGKTRVATHRVARLVAEGCDPERILLLTFSKKAADEMSARSRKLGVGDITVGTWHKLCLRILRDDDTPFRSWKPGAAPRHFLKDVLGYKGLKWNDADPNKVASFIGMCKANLEAPESEGAMHRAAKTFGGRAGLALKAFHGFNERLEDEEFLDFDDFLVRVVDHLEGDENAAAKWAGTFDHVIQDETQDENGAQKRIVRLLAGGHGNYMAIGDVYQAIYSFRGSTPASLANFEKDWPGAVTYWLPTNYRSGSSIIAGANGIVSLANVPGISPRPMVAARAELGLVTVAAHQDLEDEGKSFAARVQRAVDAGDAEYQDHCALFRTNSQSRALEDALIKARIPYVVVGGVSFYERKEVRDVLAYLRLGEGRGTLDDVGRCINAPFRFLGKAFVERVQDAAGGVMDLDSGSSAIGWGDIVTRVAEGAGIQGRQRASANEWAGFLVAISAAVARGDKPAVILGDLVRETRYLEWLRKEDGEDTIESNGASNVRELIRLSEQFPAAADLLDYIESMVSQSKRQRDDKQAGGNRVLLMNVHRSKGLEWPHVFIAGFNEGIFPHPRGDQEEERRLAYVATTRARDTLVVSHVRTMAFRDGIRDARPSPFIADMDISEVE